MIVSDEPVIAWIDPRRPHSRRAVLADVIITTSDDRKAAKQCRDLFHRYPGLTLVVVSTPSGECTVGLRDATTVTLRPGRGDGLPAAAAFLRARWSSIIDLLTWTASSSRRVVEVGELTIHHPGPR